MSIRYINDSKSGYKEFITRNLREYNSKFVSNRKESKEFFYAYDSNQMVGSISTTLFWDWVGLDDISYSDINVLRAIIFRIKEYYGDCSVGLKTYVEENTIFNELLEVGFEHWGTSSSTPLVPASYYLRLTEFTYENRSSIRIETSNERRTQFVSVDSDFNSSIDQPENETISITIVALDGEIFVGGVKGIVSNDLMYVSQLVVLEPYRAQGIGRELMSKIEEEAKQLNLYSLHLGTMEFQAPEFYKDQGFVVDFEKINDPKGYSSYSMSKKLM